MSGSTAFLILKTLLPFLKELFLKDKGFRDLIKGNVLASTLTAGLIIMLLMLIHTTERADRAEDKFETTHRENTRLSELIVERGKLIEQLEGRVQDLTASSPPPDPKPPKPPEEISTVPPPVTGPSTRGSTKPIRKKPPESGIKSYTQDLLEDLKAPGR